MQLIERAPVVVRAAASERDLVTPKYLAQVVAVASLYVVAALAGLRLDAVSGYASLVWAPTGIAIAAILLWGKRIWPGVFIGAAVANILNGAPILVAAGIGAGNTLEAVLAGYALNLIPDFRLALDRLRDAVAFIVIAAIASTAVSASMGIASLHLGGLVGPRGVPETWRTWWVGDAIGALLVAPLILVWSTGPRSRPTGRRLLEAVILLGCLIIASFIVFLEPAASGGQIGEAYVFFPLLMWAAIRFGQRGAVTASAVVSAIAVAGTVTNQGPFTQSTIHESLLALQTFIGVTSATFLVLGALVSERERSIEQLKMANDTANAANRAKADFLAVMSHELRTPLNAIAGYGELLAMGVSGELTDKQRDAVQRIRANQQHLLSLIDGVLNFARIEAGKNPVIPSEIRLCDALDSLEPLIRPDLARCNISFTWSRCDSSIIVRADPLKLRQLMLNVLGNAIKFTPKRGTIELSATATVDNAVVRIADSGIGIPADQIDRIFEPFVQVHAGTTREYSGVGLGLSIARDFARAMGGEIGIESAVGSGTVVSIRLPLIRTARTPRANVALA